MPRDPKSVEREKPLKRANVRRSSSPATKKFSEQVLIAFENPAFTLRLCELSWKETRMPYYVFKAMRICASARRKDPSLCYPGWVVLYLDECAHRMGEPSIKNTDLRVALPKAFGFNLKSGPGKPLDPDYQADTRSDFVLAFFKALLRSDDAVQALASAAERLPREIVDKIDETTMRRWVKEFFGLERWPRSKTEWIATIVALSVAVEEFIKAES